MRNGFGDVTLTQDWWSKLVRQAKSPNLWIPGAGRPCAGAGGAGEGQSPQVARQLSRTQSSPGAPHRSAKAQQLASASEHPAPDPDADRPDPDPDPDHVLAPVSRHGHGDGDSDVGVLVAASASRTDRRGRCDWPGLWKVS